MTLHDASRSSRPSVPGRDGKGVLGAGRVPWLRRYALALVLVDAIVLLGAGLLGLTARFGLSSGTQDNRGIPYLTWTIVLVPIWLVTLALSRCYETRFLGSGNDEFKRVAGASARVAAVMFCLLYMTKNDVSRGFIGISLTAGLVGVVAGRFFARTWLHRQRRHGRCVHRTVVVGPGPAAAEMAHRLQREPLSGLSVVGACLLEDPDAFAEEAPGLTVVEDLSKVVPLLADVQADTVVVATGPTLTPEQLRQLSYDLEGTGVDLLVSPRLTNVMGSRITWRSVPGLPLLHVDEPELGGARRLVKATFDRVVSLTVLVLASPVLLVLMAAIRLTSRGPAIFKQQRIGAKGRPFVIWKLRTMYADAEARRASVEHMANGDVYFKVINDPRITPLGRWLRRYSLDELPQLVNVLRGQMSLVGPRPQVQSEVDAYEGHVGRRLLVKPGMTGLWQVSGRNDLDFEDSVRLDLHYVENWSLGLDLAVLCRTVLAVLRPSGAY